VRDSRSTLKLFRRQASMPPAGGAPLGTPIGARVRTATDGRDILLNDPDGWEVDQPWLWFMGPAGGGLGPYGNPLTNDGPLFGPTSLPAVTRCTSLIADTIAGLPWHVMRGDYDMLPTPDWIGDPQATRVDGRVVGDGSALFDCRLSGMEFWSQWITAALWLGDGYVYVPVRDAAGAPKPPLWQLHPNDVTIDGGTYWVGDVPLPANSVLHLRGMVPYYSGHGRGVITVHGAELGLSTALRQYASGVFTSGVPAGYLKSSQPNMTEDAALKLKSAWLAQHGGNTRSIAVLNATTEFTPISISPVDAQLAATRDWALRDVALAFGVPAYMLGAPGDSSTYANVESRMTEFRTFTLLPWQRRIEETLSAQLPRGTVVHVVSEGLLRADTKARYETYKIGIEAGVLTADEARALEGRPPLGGEGVT
jgi:HK97 family phage portal protein